jgi:hypothetical protein
MGRRLFKDERGSPWTEEAHTLDRQVQAFMNGVLDKHKGVDLRDLNYVLRSSIDNRIVDAILKERLC